MVQGSARDSRGRDINNPEYSTLDQPVLSPRQTHIIEQRLTGRYGYKYLYLWNYIGKVPLLIIQPSLLRTPPLSMARSLSLSRRPILTKFLAPARKTKDRNASYAGTVPHSNAYASNLSFSRARIEQEKGIPSDLFSFCAKAWTHVFFKCSKRA